MIVALIVVAGLWGPVLVSLLVEAMRATVREPERLTWAPDIPIQHVVVGGHRLRYIKVGRGPNLVLLHTLRTQLDIFQKVVEPLSSCFCVYAVDYPGHGYSDIPRVDYEPQVFVDAIAGFLDTLAIQDATLAGVSIGATTALLLAARHHPRVACVVAINTYDYARGLGIRRSSLVANLVVGAAVIPILGETAMRFRTRWLEAFIFNGGVADADAMPPQLRDEMSLVGTRPRHYRAFISLLRHAYKWDEAHAQYGKVSVPTLLVYGVKDWSYESERVATGREIPEARVEEVSGGGHFLPLDRPQEVERLIIEFAAGRRGG
jgi:pimeloyl-ACP methyl ester carboxylesterase